MKAVHFGAGNIGRGFVGLLLHEAGYEVVFADVAEDLIAQLAAADSYRVHEVGEHPTVRTVDNFRALNSGTQEAEVIAEIATADIVTTAVGPHILKFVAPVIARGIAARAAGLAPLQVMACENAINATDILKSEVSRAVGRRRRVAGRCRRVREHGGGPDRAQPGGRAGPGRHGGDVLRMGHRPDTVRGAVPVIPGATFVDELAPYIERKLFTVNTGHAAAAYFGFEAGLEKISEAMADQDVADDVRAVLDETKELLVAKHGFNRDEQEAYVQKILGRFSNPHLPDTVNRVGRAPLRKLSRHERFIGPAAELAERGIVPEALLGAIAAALRFNDPADAEAVELRRDPGILQRRRGNREDHRPRAGPSAVHGRLRPGRRGQGRRLVRSQFREAKPPTPELTRVRRRRRLCLRTPPAEVTDNAHVSRKHGHYLSPREAVRRAARLVSGVDGCLRGALRDEEGFGVLQGHSVGLGDLELHEEERRRRERRVHGVGRGGGRPPP